MQRTHEFGVDGHAVIIPDARGARPLAFPRPALCNGRMLVQPRTSRRRGSRVAPAILVVMLALAAAIGVAAGPASSAPPAGMNTLFFSPSGSGSCGGGSISSVGEASAGPGQPPTNPTVVNGGGSPVWLSNGTGGYTLANLDGPYASGMAATSWNYSFGYPWPPLLTSDLPGRSVISEENTMVFPAPAGRTGPAWSTLVYFTSNCGKPQDMSNFLMAQCVQSNDSLVLPRPLGSCDAYSGCLGPECPTNNTPAWAAYTTLGASGSATSFVGAGLAMDTTRNILYFTTAPNGCTGPSTCSVSVWSSPVAKSYGQPLTPTLVTTIPGVTSPSYMAVDPIGQTLYLTGRSDSTVISVPTAGGSAATVLSGSNWISGELVTGMAFDASTGVLYVMSSQTGDEPSQIVQVPTGGSPSLAFGPGSLPGNDPMAIDAEPIALAVDPANALLAWAAQTQGFGPAQGTANTIAYGLLDGGPSSGPGVSVYSWFGLPDASWAANINALTFAGGVGTCQYQGTTYPCPTTTVAAAGTSARAVADSTLMIPMRAYRVAPEGPAPPAQATEHSGSTSTTVRGPMVVAFRDRRSRRTLATVRPGFTLRANARGLRKVTIPGAAREAVRTGRLEVRVRSRNAGTGQRWRTRTLRVLAR